MGYDTIVKKANRVSAKPYRPEPPRSIAKEVKAKLVGHDAFVDRVIPYVHHHVAGLAADNRPLGIFLITGPTGTGKTRLVEAFSEAIHDNPTPIMLTVNCGEYQMEHEIAKLVGAPPGYLGHRETQPALTQTKLNAMTSENSNISVLLLDEVEKASRALQQLLLGVFDKGKLRLADGNVVDFSKTLIFMTSNLGSKEIQEIIAPSFGLGGKDKLGDKEIFGKVQKAADATIKRFFSPEFINRLDEVMCFSPLTEENIKDILDIELNNVQRHIIQRMGARAIKVTFDASLKEYLTKEGFSPLYGARPLKRLINKVILQEVSAAIVREGYNEINSMKFSYSDGKVMSKINLREAAAGISF